MGCYSATTALPTTEVFWLASQTAEQRYELPRISLKDMGDNTDWSSLSLSPMQLDHLRSWKLTCLSRLQYRDETVAKGLLGALEEVGRMLSGLRKSLKGARRLP